MKPRRGGLRGKDSSGGWTAATCISIKQDDCGSPLTAAIMLVCFVICQATPAALPAHSAGRRGGRGVERLALRPLRHTGAAGAGKRSQRVVQLKPKVGGDNCSWVFPR